MNRRNPAQLLRLGTHSATARQRGFTLLELVLASMLGGAVILAIMGLMSAIRITEVRTRSINRGLVDLNRVHSVATKALSQIVVLPPAKSKKKEAPGAEPLPTSSDELDADGQPKDKSSEQRPPRILLETDALNPGQQRLELLVAEPPALGGIDGSNLQGSRGSWFSKQRGAFELVARAKLEEGNDLYWVVFPLLEGDASASGSSKADLVPTLTGTPSVAAQANTDDAPTNDLITDATGATARLLIAEKVMRLNWRMVKSNENGAVEPFTEGRVLNQNELPAYFEADIALASGHSVVWMFEVGWVTEAVKESGPNRLGDRDPSKPEGGSGGSNNLPASGFDSGKPGGRSGPTGGNPSTGGRSRGTGSNESGRPGGSGK